MFHFSENPDITLFVPHVPKTNPGQPPLVWAIDEEHAPHYYFPRDCPRIAFWTTPNTTPGDRDSFFAHTSARRIIAIESDWLNRVRDTRLYVYHLPGETFECVDANAGYYASSQSITPLAVEPVGDLLERLVEAKVELRITPSLWKLRHALISSSVAFSMIRMGNASPDLVSD
nr:DUF6886 family protein [Paenactinomyces guangxiensis]